MIKKRIKNTFIHHSPLGRGDCRLTSVIVLKYKNIVEHFVLNQSIM